MSETSPKLYACSRLVLLSDYHPRGGFGGMVPKGFLEGWIHFYAGNKERAYTALDSVRWILEMEAKENPGDQAGPSERGSHLCGDGLEGRRAGGSRARERKAKWMADGGAFGPCRRARRRIAPPRAASCYRARTLITICV
jgi:hypothetical protein